MLLEDPADRALGQVLERLVLDRLRAGCPGLRHPATDGGTAFVACLTHLIFGLLVDDATPVRGAATRVWRLLVLRRTDAMKRLMLLLRT